MKFHALWCRFCSWWCDAKTVERLMLKDAGDWVYDVFFCVCKLGGSFARDIFKLGYGGLWFVQVWVRWETEGFVWKLSDTCQQHVWGWRNVTLTCSCNSRSFNWRFGWWSDVCNLENVSLLYAVRVFWSGFFRLLFLRYDCERNRPSFLATVFHGALAFNGDLNHWDVAKVTAMNWSKSLSK
jgi:hypothetical protein